MTAFTHKEIMQDFSEEMIRIFPRRMVGSFDSGALDREHGRSVG